VTASGPDLAVSRAVVIDIVRLAAAESPGVLRIGRRGRLRRLLGARAIDARIDGRSVTVRIHVIVRVGASLPATAEGVREAVAAAIGRVLGLAVGRVTVVVDGVGG
jgi:uncharacterized alkaline shock family protein YloU